MNVAITRAKRLLCIVGNSKTISYNKFMKFIVESILKNGQIIKAIEFDGVEI